MKTAPKSYYSTFDTAFGLYSVATDESGAVIATAFGDIGQLSERIAGSRLLHDEVRAAAARAQVCEYLVGLRSEFDLPLAAQGSDFQQRVWMELRRIPRGQTRSYGDLARELGSSARAVGRANATNPICLIVPCHRVIGADGSLTGFAFGERMKERLLTLEGARGFHAALLT